MFEVRRRSDVSLAYVLFEHDGGVGGRGASRCVLCGMRWSALRFCALGEVGVAGVEWEDSGVQR